MLTDDDLRGFVAQLPRFEIVGSMARELLAARAVVKAARGVENCGTCICAPALPLEQALARYDNAIKKQETPT